MVWGNFFRDEVPQIAQLSALQLGSWKVFETKTQNESNYDKLQKAIFMEDPKNWWKMQKSRPIVLKLV